MIFIRLPDQKMDYCTIVISAKCHFQILLTITQQNCFDMSGKKCEKQDRSQYSIKEDKWRKAGILLYKPKKFETKDPQGALPQLFPPWRQITEHIWLLATSPCPHIQQAVSGSVPAHSLCVLSACYEF